MISFLLLIGLACANAASIDTSCAAGQWSSWGECVSSKHCSSTPISLETYHAKATKEWDEGRTTMLEIQRRKLEAWDYADRCKAEGTCPELMRQPIHGAYECEDGLAGDIPCLHIDQLSYLSFTDMGYQNRPTELNARGNDCWGWEDPLNGDEYAIMGLAGATTFVRITDPKNPVPVGIIYTATVHSSWRDIKVIGNFAYIVSEAIDHGLQVFDLTHLRGRNTVEVFQPDAVNKDFGQAHNIASNSDTNFVYVVGARRQTQPSYRLCDGGLLILDVSDPLNPRYAGCFGDDGYVHDTQCVIYNGPDSRYTGQEICFCFNENSLTIVDVTDKDDMKLISKEVYINVAYTHQGWLTEDHAVLLLDDEQDEQNKPNEFTKTYVWDVKDLMNPELRTVYQASVRSIDHNQYIIGDLTYQGNYESGLRINHINSQTFELTNVAYFDVFPLRTTAQFNGAWSVYPYFRSGTVIISSINDGLFMTRPNLTKIRQLIDTNTTYAEQTRTRIGNATCPIQQETRMCSAPVLC